MKNVQKFVLIVCCALFVAACSNNSDVEYEAQKYTVNQAIAAPGFAWMEPTMMIYTPDAELVKEITQAFNADTTTQFIVYVNPSCSCTGSKQTFPHAVRVLRDAKIPDSHIDIYAMRSHKDKHPLSTKYTLNGLPNIYVERKGQPVYSIETRDEQLFEKKKGGAETPVDILSKGYVEIMLLKSLQ